MVLNRGISVYAGGMAGIPAMVGPAQKDSPTKEKKVKVKGLRVILEAKKVRLGVGQGVMMGGTQRRPEIGPW